MIAAVEISKDRRLAAVVSIGSATLVFVVLHFLTYRIPMPPLPEQLKYQNMEAEFIELTPESLPETATAGGGGGGEQVNAPKSDHFEEQMQEVVQTNNSNFSHPSGKSNHTNTNHPTNNGPSTKNPDVSNPFDNDGGSGGGSGGGNGGGIGKDDGPTSGGGHGSGTGAGQRSLIHSPNADDINSDEDCKITYKVQIAADGSVISARVVYGGGTTTSNINLINKGAALIKSQARYTAAKGSAIVEKVFVLRLQPQ